MAYYDSKLDRVLLRDGTSIVSPRRYAQMLIEGQDVSGIHVLDSFDADVYNFKYSTDISREIELVEVHPVQSHDASEEMFNALVESILSSPRFKDSEEYQKRIEDELEFFVRTSNVVFLIECHRLISQMKENGDVWGVGRGSSCASLLLFILGVTDIDPVKYDIPFSELSKEIEASKWE